MSLLDGNHEIVILATPLEHLVCVRSYLFRANVKSTREELERAWILKWFLLRVHSSPPKLRTEEGPHLAAPLDPQGHTARD